MTLQVFSLHAENLLHPDWQASTYKGDCLVYAETEDKAREFATLEFFIAASHTPGQLIPSNPWRNPELVTCTVAHSVSNLRPEMNGMIMLPDGAN